MPGTNDLGVWRAWVPGTKTISQQAGEFHSGQKVFERSLRILVKGGIKFQFIKAKEIFFTRNLFTSHFSKEQFSNEKAIIVLIVTKNYYDCRYI